MHLLTSDYCLNTLIRVKRRSSKNFFLVSRIIYCCIGGSRSVIFRRIFTLPPIFLDLLHSMICIKIYWHVVYVVELILTIGILREFVMSLKVMIYAKQNGAQMATFAATGTKADIDDLRKTMAALGTRLNFPLK